MYLFVVALYTVVKPQWLLRTVQLVVFSNISTVFRLIKKNGKKITKMYTPNRVWHRLVFYTLYSILKVIYRYLKFHAYVL